MPKIKLTDVARTATLLKKLAVKVDTNLDGDIRAGEIARISPQHPRDPSVVPKQQQLRSAIHGAQRFAMSRGSVTVEAVQQAVEEIAARVKAADKDRDGVISEAEYKSLSTLAEKRFVDFGSAYASSKVTDFSLTPQREHPRPRFSWSGTPAQVCSSLLESTSEPKNDNFWPSWGGKGASRYVLSRTEAEAMVKALEPLFAARQKSVLTELAGRTASSTFGCVACDAGARTVFQAYARRLGVQGLTFGNPTAPKMPSP